MNEWNTDFYNVSILCTDKFVRIKNDKSLVDFLNDPKTEGASLISEYAHELYEKEMGKPLKITKDSLAIEILGHVYADKFAKVAEKLGIKQLKVVAAKIKEHTDIIDCGERDVDSNRVVWDDLEKAGLKRVIYRICGRMA